MSGSTALSRGAEAVLAQQPAKRFATEREALVFHEFLAEMVIVEADVGAAGQPQEALAHGLGQAAVAGPPPLGVTPTPPPHLPPPHSLPYNFHSPPTHRAHP